MHWIALTDIKLLENIQKDSFTVPQIIFKHSLTCSISKMALARMERSIPPENIPFYFLDLLNYRSISNTIAEKFGIPHESPQVLIIKNGICTFDASHGGIEMEEIIEQAAL